MSAYLFVGGPHDGEWHGVMPEDTTKGPAPRRIWRLHKWEPVPTNPAGEPIIARASAKESVYTRSEWYAEGREFYIYAYGNLTPSMVLDMLCRNYSGHNS